MILKLSAEVVCDIQRVIHSWLGRKEGPVFSLYHVYAANFRSAQRLVIGVLLYCEFTYITTVMDPIAIIEDYHIMSQREDLTEGLFFLL